MSLESMGAKRVTDQQLQQLGFQSGNKLTLEQAKEAATKLAGSEAIVDNKDGTYSLYSVAKESTEDVNLHKMAKDDPNVLSFQMEKKFLFFTYNSEVTAQSLNEKYPTTSSEETPANPTTTPTEQTAQTPPTPPKDYMKDSFSALKESYDKLPPDVKKQLPKSITDLLNSDISKLTGKEIEAKLTPTDINSMRDTLNFVAETASPENKEILNKTLNNLRDVSLCTVNTYDDTYFFRQDDENKLKESWSGIQDSYEKLSPAIQKQLTKTKELLKLDPVQDLRASDAKAMLDELTNALKVATPSEKKALTEYIDKLKVVAEDANWVSCDEITLWTEDIVNCKDENGKSILPQLKENMDKYGSVIPDDDIKGLLKEYKSKEALIKELHDKGKITPEQFQAFTAYGQWIEESQKLSNSIKALDIIKNPSNSTQAESLPGTTGATTEETIKNIQTNINQLKADLASGKISDSDKKNIENQIKIGEIAIKTLTESKNKPTDELTGALSKLNEMESTLINSYIQDMNTNTRVSKDKTDEILQKLQKIEDVKSSINNLKNDPNLSVDQKVTMAENISRQIGELNKVVDSKDAGKLVMINSALAQYSKNIMTEQLANSKELSDIKQFANAKGLTNEMSVIDSPATSTTAKMAAIDKLLTRTDLTPEVRKSLETYKANLDAVQDKIEARAESMERLLGPELADTNKQIQRLTAMEQAGTITPEDKQYLEELKVKKSNLEQILKDAREGKPISNITDLAGVLSKYATARLMGDIPPEIRHPKGEHTQKIKTALTQYLPQIKDPQVRALVDSYLANGDKDGAYFEYMKALSSLYINTTDPAVAKEIEDLFLAASAGMPKGEEFAKAKIKQLREKRIEYQNQVRTIAPPPVAVGDPQGSGGGNQSAEQIFKILGGAADYNFKTTMSLTSGTRAAAQDGLINIGKIPGLDSLFSNYSKSDTALTNSLKDLSAYEKENAIEVNMVNAMLDSQNTEELKRQADQLEATLDMTPLPDSKDMIKLLREFRKILNELDTQIRDVANSVITRKQMDEHIRQIGDKIRREQAEYHETKMDESLKKELDSTSKMITDYLKKEETAVA